MAITLTEVAERAGVSRSAVSRTFTPGASVAPATRDKVLKAAAELGYSPNLLARSLTTRSTGMIGLVLNNFHNPVYLQIFDLLTQGLQQRGLRPLLVNLTGETDPEKTVGLLRQYSVDGVVVTSSTLPSGFARMFRDVGLPTVHAFGRVGADPDVDVVSIDNIGAGRLAASTLIARGYRRLGFIGGPGSASTSQDRLLGFRDEIARHEGVSLTHSFAASYSFDAGYAEMRTRLKASREEAYFCGDDVLSIGAMSALRDAGLRVPQDVGVLGLNDMEMSGWSNIGLTTIRQPFEEIVSTVLDRLTALCATPDLLPIAVQLPCRIVERASLRPVQGQG